MALVQWSAAYLVREWHQMPPHLVVADRQAVKYLSNATSTVILRVAREHFRLVWAALTFMDRVPVKNGKPCIFRVVRVSGTIRKVEEEAIRRARLCSSQPRTRWPERSRPPSTHYSATQQIPLPM